MSMGYGGFARQLDEDSVSVIYEYGGYNLNEPEFKNAERICDGILSVSKDCFIEPEIHQWIRRMPSGRKKFVIKRIPREVNIAAELQNGKISIENCSHSWHLCTFPGNRMVDLTATRLPDKLFIEYQRTGKIPENIFWDC